MPDSVSSSSRTPQPQSHSLHNNKSCKNNVMASLWSRMLTRTTTTTTASRSPLHHSTASEPNYSPVLFSSLDNSIEELGPYTCPTTLHPHHHNKSDPTLLTHKYQPKCWRDIVGHEINLRVISNAVETLRIGNLYLFHGPSGTGKTSTARVFAMALQCQSSSTDKPCWTCTGCSRSLYMMELCSGSRVSGFQRISTLVRSTSFTQALPGLKVFIIEEAHSLNSEAWEEILRILESASGANLVFVLITGDANMMPRAILSKCHKLCFPRLKNTDVMLKLARIVAWEEIGVEEEALQLIVAKAGGSLREAEHILDQLSLLGTRITTSMVQQLVGLVPERKLIDLLAGAFSGDTTRTITNTAELVASSIEPPSILSQLASLITDILSDAAVPVPNSTSLAFPSKDKRLMRSESELVSENCHSERLCDALKILIEAEKRCKSSPDQITETYDALLQIASLDVTSEVSRRIQKRLQAKALAADKMVCCSRSSASDKSSNKASQQRNVGERYLEMAYGENLNGMNAELEETLRFRGQALEVKTELTRQGDMEEIWSNIVDNIQSADMKEFLRSHAKLASLTVSTANAIVHLMLKTAEDKQVAQGYEESMSKALESAIGFPIILNMSLEPGDVGIIQECTASTRKYSGKQKRVVVSGDFEHDRDEKVRLQLMAGAREGPPRKAGENAAGEKHSTTSQKYGQGWVSVTSIQQSDVSVEPYSQDILFEKANIDGIYRRNRKLQNVKADDDGGGGDPMKEWRGLLRSWSCKEGLCHNK